MDLVVLGLLNKAFQVHRSVMILCSKRAGPEAYALSRIVVEIFLALRWITNDDQHKRAKQYGFFGIKRKQYLAGVAEKYYPDSPEWKSAVARKQAVINRYGREYKYFTFWANLPTKLKGMAAEKEKLEASPPAPSDMSWDYAFPYSMASDHVHATIVAVDDLLPEPGVPFRVSLTPHSRHIDDAIFTATTYLFRITSRADTALGLGLDAEIARVFKPFRKKCKPARTVHHR